MKLNVKRTVLVGIAFMTISTFWQLYDFIIPLILKNEFLISDSISGFVMSIDNILALFLLPVFGAISDKTRTRWGKRMPFIVVGTIVTVIAMILLPLAATHSYLWLFILSLALVLFAIATYRSPAVALMPDVTIKPLRSKGNAIINLMGALGGVMALLTLSLLSYSKTGSYYPMFIVVALIMSVGLLIMLATIRENSWSQQMSQQSIALGIEEKETDETVVTKKVLEPAVKRSLILILLSISLWFMGYNAVISAFSRYATLHIGLTDGQASNILLVANVGAIISFIPIGNLASKIGRKKTILGGVVMLTLSFATAFLYNGFSPLMFINFVLAGSSWAAINVNSLPMVLEMAQGGEVGKYTGLYYTFSMSAQIITPTFSGILFDVLDYGVLFPYASFFVALSFITMFFVKHGDSRLDQYKPEDA